MKINDETTTKTSKICTNCKNTIVDEYYINAQDATYNKIFCCAKCFCEYNNIDVNFADSIELTKIVF